ncbi:thiamine pyrophosphate-dependent dehydrogenase E1 component subunit alpha [Ureibacillus massiliensis]|uniref:thiamine pyrophosphate-dependent dehydrogenase E1 component subunit alpha n=1 Tax=Ureibacillus massiliensis TaxID=292806 RepID=UPI000A5E0299|nr:thiamine pyrophosphate-dependent dehydrogenase E1 component subunit alpha [Ureibacillus massiliensis]
MDIKFIETEVADYNVTQQQAESIWSKLSEIRYFEEKSIEAYKQGLLGGSLHPYIGQEAVATGIGEFINESDYMTTTYRGRGHALAKGADPFKLFAEMFGRVDGYCKGKGGPMHIANSDLGMLGANGIVAGGIPIAVGAAITAKSMNKGQVAITYFGDGATNQGVFHEAMNLAAIMKLPVIFICENNLYSEMTPIKDSVLNEHLAERGLAYRIPSYVVDGNDVFAVRKVAKLAIEFARNGDGPVFIEAKTYRLLGHMFGDTEIYRTKEEVNSWIDKEPLKQFKRRMLESNILSEEKLDEIEESVKILIDDAFERAKKSEQPGFEEVYTDVY